jgi:replicative DNA helicase
VSRYIQNIEAESSVIGGLLLLGKDLQSKAAQEALTSLTQDDFSNYDNRRTFQTIQRLAQAQEPADLITITSRDSSLDFASLATLMAQTPSSANLLSYVQLVKEASGRRAQVNAMQEAIRYLVNGDDELAAGSLAAVEVERSDTAIGWTWVRDMARDFVMELQSRIDAGGLYKGLTVGIREIDEVLMGIRAGLYILAGRPGTGKTTLGIKLIQEASKVAPALMISLEMPKEQLYERLTSYESGVDQKMLRSPVSFEDSDWGRLNEGLSKLGSSNIAICDLPSMTANQIMAVARKFQRQNGLSMLCVDYLQLIKTMKAEKRTDAVGDATKALRLIGRSLGVPVLLLCQLNRNSEMTNRRPKPSDLRDSGEIEQEADVIMMLHNPDADDYIEVLITKNRHGERKEKGEIAMRLTGTGFVPCQARRQGDEAGESSGKQRKGAKI